MGVFACFFASRVCEVTFCSGARVSRSCVMLILVSPVQLRRASVLLSHRLWLDATRTTVSIRRLPGKAEVAARSEVLAPVSITQDRQEARDVRSKPFRIRGPNQEKQWASDCSRRYRAGHRVLRLVSRSALFARQPAARLANGFDRATAASSPHTCAAAAHQDHDFSLRSSLSCQGGLRSAENNLA